ncbi:MAG: DUF3874 domain-containing protein [Prevotella sp.]|nr:DUF3874 domain-containing protein [Prevotella sp.]
MKFTLIRTTKQNKCHLKTATIGEVMQTVQADEQFGLVDGLRHFVRYATPYSVYKYMHRLPLVVPSAEMKADRGGNLVMTHNNGLLTLSVGPLCDDDEAEAVKNRAAMLPMTVAAMLGSSGRTVKIIVGVSRPGGVVPQTEDEAERLLRQASPLVCALYGVVVRIASNDRTVTVAPALPGGETALLHTGFRTTYDAAPIVCASPAPLQVPDGLPLASLADVAATAAKSAADAEETADAGAVSQKMRSLIQLLESNYAFRMNTVMGYAEYRSKEKWHLGWRPVDDRVQNSLAMEARLAGLDAWDRDISRYVKSNMVPSYDPIDEYLWDLSDKWDGQDHIGRLARTVPTQNPNWPRWFRTWFLGMVAQWRGMNPRYGNAMAPLLISRQGYNKSTFCKSLIPMDLQWGYCDNLVLAEKKAVLQAMSQFLLINLDEFNQISPKVQEGFLKNLIQLASVKVKRPYGRHVEEFPRLASFIATANMTDILADPTGNRRFIGIELTGPIDTSYRINHRQLYAQAMTLLDQGEPYWLDDEQTRLVMESNRQFQQQSPVELYFGECFQPAASADEGEWMTTAAIYQHIRRVAGAAVGRVGVISFGRFLANQDSLIRRRSRNGTEYLLRKLNFR